MDIVGSTFKRFTQSIYHDKYRTPPPLEVLLILEK